MWVAFVEAVKDLWVFFVESVFKTNQPASLLLTAPDNVLPLQSSSELPKDTTLHTSVSAQKAFATSTSQIFLRPGIHFDEVVATSSFGEAVVVLEAKAGWYQIVNDRLTGWIEASNVTFDKKEIFPEFVSGRRYDAAAVETIVVRQWLGDLCAGGLMRIALQPIEYILYTLQTHGIVFDFGCIRPRTPGTLYTLLRGQAGVEIGVTPKTGTLIEYIDVDDTSVLAYVTAVHPDQSIVVKGIVNTATGQYKEVQLSEAAWRELRPVFIQFI